jgi:hypothetical protein
MFRTGLLAIVAVVAAASMAFAADEPKPGVPSTRSYLGIFGTSTLAGGTTNELTVPVRPENLQLLSENDQNGASVKWLKWDAEAEVNTRACPRHIDIPRPSETIVIRSKKPVEGDLNKTRLSVDVPPTPCWWPIYQTARLKIAANVTEDGNASIKTLFDEEIDVSVFWFPFAVTLLLLALIYPGCAMVVFYLRQLRYDKDCEIAKKKGQAPPEEPHFLGTLDPVQITANPHGRGSLAKLQIFIFSIIVFGLLLFYQLRYGILAAMSPDVMLLMGISAVGAAGAKITYAKKRRLSLASWNWLRMKGWIPVGQDVQTRAKWSELFLDSDTKEFDPYSFQMAMFSLVVAVAMVRSGVGGLGGFKIPTELLELLGLSQAVFIGGKAIEGSAYEELEKLLKDVRDHETKYLALKDDQSPEKQADKAAELTAFKNGLPAVAEMFWAVYVEQLPEKPTALNPATVAAMEPGGGAIVVPASVRS